MREVGLFAPPRRGWAIGGPLEGTRERGLGVLADIQRDRGHGEVGAAQQVRGQLHAPVGQVLHWRLPDEAHEALV
jgi:hypothetical protein